MKKISGKRFLIVDSTCHEWNLGSHVKKILQSKNMDCSLFGYYPFKSIEESNKALLELATRYKPDILLGIKMKKIKPDTLKELKRREIFLVLWYVDCTLPEVPAWIKPLIREADTFLVSAKGMIPEYEKISNTPVYWMYEGAHLPAFPTIKLKPSLHRLYGSQVAFVGNLFSPPVADEKIAYKRVRLLKKISQEYRLKVWGPQGDPRTREKWGSSRYPVVEWPAYNEELVKVCQTSDIVLGINSLNCVELYFSNRTFLTLAAGGFHITEYVPKLESMFRNHEHLVWFKSNQECLDLIDYYLKRPSLRKKIAAQGQRWTRARYSTKKQVNKILNIIGARRTT